MSSPSSHSPFRSPAGPDADRVAAEGEEEPPFVKRAMELAESSDNLLGGRMQAVVERLLQAEEWLKTEPKAAKLALTIHGDNLRIYRDHDGFGCWSAAKFGARMAMAMFLTGDLADGELYLEDVEDFWPRSFGQLPKENRDMALDREIRKELAEVRALYEAIKVDLNASELELLGFRILEMGTQKRRLVAISPEETGLAGLRGEKPFDGYAVVLSDPSEKTQVEAEKAKADQAAEGRGVMAVTTTTLPAEAGESLRAILRFAR